jgi:hypothetical protein
MKTIMLSGYKIEMDILTTGALSVLIRGVKTIETIMDKDGNYSIDEIDDSDNESFSKNKVTNRNQGE